MSVNIHIGAKYDFFFLLSLSGREAAVKLGQDLYRGHFIHHVTFDHEFKDEYLFYRVLGDGHLKALNAKLSYACIPRPGMIIMHTDHTILRGCYVHFSI